MSSYMRVLQFVKPYKMLIVLSLIASLLYVSLNSASIWMVGTLVSRVVTPDAGSMTDQVLEDNMDISLNDKLRSVTDILVGDGEPVSQLQRLCMILLMVFLLKNIFFYVNKVVLDWVQTRMITDIRTTIFEHIHTLPLSFFDQNKSAEIQSILIRDVNVMRTAFTQSIQKLLVEPLNIIAFLIPLFIISVKLTFISLLMIPISAVFILKLGQSIRRKARRSSKQIAGVMNVMQETLTGMRIVKAFSMEKFEISRFIDENNRFFKLIFRQTRLRTLSTPVNEMIGVLLGIVLLWYGGMEVLAHQGLEGEDFMRFILLLFAMMQPARVLGNLNAQVQTGLASAERVFGILDTKSTLTEIPDPVELSPFQDRICFRDVSFQYESGDSPALRHINLTIAKGQIVALVGMSGSGKTTLADMIPRFYDVTHGEITIDGHDVRDISFESLRSRMGIVTQETILFNDSIFNNIAYGKTGVTASAVEAAARAANAFDFIQRMPDGFDTVVGEKGTRLSGGEKQRISIARAILKNPEILILDEATSALDSEAENKVQKAIDELVKDRTVIVIAHRLSTIQKADQIVVMDEGRILETGSHEELMAHDGKYRQLHDLQFRGRG